MKTELKQLDSRADINLLVRTFYQSVRADELLGPIFNGQIDDWEEHLETLTNFWESNLLFGGSYRGHPGRVHIEVDRATNGSITQVHFGKWLQLWHETIDAHFDGDNAHIAKNRARNMASHFFMKMFAARPH